MKHRHGETVAAEFLGDAFGSAFGTCKHQTAAGLIAQQPLQHLVLAVRRHFKRLHAYILRWLERGIERQPNRIAHVAVHETRDGSIQRCGKA